MSQFGYKIIMGDTVANFAKAKVNYIHCYLLLPDPVILTEEAIRLVRHDLPLVNSCLLFPVTTFSFMCPEMYIKALAPWFSQEPIWGQLAAVPWIVLLAFCKDWYNNRLFLVIENLAIFHDISKVTESGTVRMLACWAPWSCTGWVLSSNPWLSPCPLLAVPPGHVQWPRRYGRHHQCRLREGFEYFRLTHLCCLSAIQPMFSLVSLLLLCNSRSFSCWPWGPLEISMPAELWLSQYHSLYALATFLNSSFVACPCFHLFYAAFWCRDLHCEFPA